MFNRQQKIDAALFLSKLSLIGVYILGYGFLWYRFYSESLWSEPFFAKGDYTVIALFILLYVFLARLYGGFDLTLSSPGELIYAQTISLTMATGFMYMVTWLLIRYLPALLPTLGLWAAFIAIATAWANLAHRLANRLLPPERILLLYGNADARADGREILESLPLRFTPMGEIAVMDGSAAIGAIREANPDSIMLCGVESSLRNDIVKYCVSGKIRAYVRPSIGDYLIKGARSMQLNNLPVLMCAKSEPTVWYLAIKRGMDILLSLLALVIFSPIMLVTAAAIKLYDGGPVFYKQVRLTKNRREFYVYKFRSMRVDAEKDGVARLASQNDDRITPVGRFIRKVRIDEMPQLFCILFGTMTIVGPRPERPEIAAQYEVDMPEFALRLQAKAGLTGLAQVYGKYNTTPYNKLQMDLQYIGSMNLVTDLKIILATIKILFMPESTEGVSQGQITADKHHSDGES